VYYLIKDSVEECAADELREAGYGYAAVLTSEQWQKQKESFDMGIELEPDAKDIHGTKAEVNFDSLTGTFMIPDRSDLSGNSFKFAFALDEKGIVFIDESGKAEEMIRGIMRTKRWRKPSLERFLYDFLEQIVDGDLTVIEKYDSELDALENSMLSSPEQTDLIRVNEIRGDIRELWIHYEQLIDMGQELEENENGFFDDGELRYFHLFMTRMARLHDAAAALREHTMQVRDLYHAQLEVKQNRIMTLLTVVTTVFMPLTLIAGWYGMNFHNMPELSSRWGYPAVIGVSILIVAVSLIFFKKKKWL
jgi:magnesium transporter